MSDGDNRDSGPLSIDEYLDDLGEPEEGQSAGDEEETDEEAEEIEAEASETDAEEETEDQDEPEADDDAPDAYPVSEYGDITVELKDGTRTTLEALAAGNLRQSDYSRKTAELAEQRKALEAEKADLEAQSWRLQEYVASLEETEPDWEALAEEDPIGWSQEKLKWDKKQAVKAQAQKRAEAQRQQEIQQFRAKTVAIAMDAIPEWQNDGEFEKGADARKATALAAGFTEQEYSAALDFRLAALLEWAARGRAKADKVSATQKKLAKVPKIMKPGAGKSSKADRDAAERTARDKRLSGPVSVDEYLQAKGL